MTLSRGFLIPVPELANRARGGERGNVARVHTIYRETWGLDTDSFVWEPELIYSAIAIAEYSEACDCEIYEVNGDPNRPWIPSCRSPIRGPIRGPLLIKPRYGIDAGNADASSFIHSLALRLYADGFHGEIAPVVRPDRKYTYGSDDGLATSYPAVPNLLVPFRGRRSFSLGVGHESSTETMSVKVIASTTHKDGEDYGVGYAFTGDVLQEETGIDHVDGKLFQWAGEADFIAVYAKYSGVDAGNAVVATLTVRD